MRYLRAQTQQMLEESWQQGCSEETSNVFASCA